MKTGIILCICGVIGIAHHWVVSGRLWDWEDFWHHEPLIAIAFSIGLVFIFKEKL